MCELVLNAEEWLSSAHSEARACVSPAPVPWGSIAPRGHSHPGQQEALFPLVSEKLGTWDQKPQATQGEMFPYQLNAFRTLGDLET